MPQPKAPDQKPEALIQQNLQRVPQDRIGSVEGNVFNSGKARFAPRGNIAAGFKFPLAPKQCSSLCAG
jgi:hypothetical protein